jgi:hypothetical protein
MRDRILAIDPSGAFYEGKGTSGICYFNALDETILSSGCLLATDYTKPTDFWRAHKDFIVWAHDETPGQLAIVMEDYLIYASRADTHINSHMETSQLIGYLKVCCDELDIPVTMQKACDVKSRWSNTILLHKGYIFRQGRHLACNTETGTTPLCDHQIDAIRHAVHYSKFKNVK